MRGNGRGAPSAFPGRSSERSRPWTTVSNPAPKRSPIRSARFRRRSTPRTPRAAASPRTRPVQAGARKYPEPPFPKQHQTKPGDEAALDPAPMYDAPFWKGSGKLEGMAALITGGDSGIGRAVAVLFAREGCDVAICHLDEDKDAADTKAAVEAEGRKAIVLKGDVADPGLLRSRGEGDAERLRPARRRRAQRRLPGTCRGAGGPDLRAFRPDAEDQSLRLFQPGEGGGPAPEAGRRRSS